MAYYIAKFENRYFASKEMYMGVFSIGPNSMIDRAVFKSIFGTTVVGPLEEDEYKVLVQYEHTMHDVDEQIQSLVPMEGWERSVSLPYKGISEVFNYGELTFMRVADIIHARKYRLLDKMALVRVCGRKNMYVCLNMKRKGVEDPFVIKIAN